MPKAIKAAKEAPVSAEVKAIEEPQENKPVKSRAKKVTEPVAVNAAADVDVPELAKETKTKKEKPKKVVSDKSATVTADKVPDKVKPAPAPEAVPPAAPQPAAVEPSEKAPAKGDGFVSDANQSSTEVKKMETKQKQQVRYSDEDLEMFRLRIMDVRKEAIEELSMLKDRLEDLTNYDVAEESMIYSMHMAEQGSEFIEKEKTYAQIQRINEYIKKLDEAVQRINDKSYGICRVCGCLIARERLLAVPITTLSASYKIHKKCPDDGIDRIEPLK